MCFRQRCICSWRENKNSYLLNWLVSQIERDYVFPGGIEVGFLPKGHTHNECDQAASRIAVALRHRDVLVPADLMVLLREAYPGARVRLVNSVADTKG